MQLLIAAVLAGTPALAPLEYRFEVRRAEGTLYNPWTLSEDKVELRSFVGSGANPGDFVAPTIRVAPGQRLGIAIDNRLEPCTEDQRKKHACFNDHEHPHAWAVGVAVREQRQCADLHPSGRSLSVRI